METFLLGSDKRNQRESNHWELSIVYQKQSIHQRAQSNKRHRETKAKVVWHQIALHSKRILTIIWK